MSLSTDRHFKPHFSPTGTLSLAQRTVNCVTIRPSLAVFPGIVRFALYYDAIDGNRYPVAVDPADPNRDGPEAWRLTIAALDPAVANSNLSMPVSFIAPANDGSPQSPKVANEYILVFSGNMGAELGRGKGDAPLYWTR